MNVKTLLVGTLMLSALSAQADISWAKNWEAAKSSAAASSKLIMIDFYTDW